MDKATFIALRQDILDRNAAFKKELDKEYTRYCREYLAENSPVEKGKVYEVEEGRKKRKYSRFVVYQLEPSFSLGNDDPIIQAGGWWLDDNGVPAEWETRIVAGIGNPTVFRLSDDQHNEPHPDSKTAAEAAQ